MSESPNRWSERHGGMLVAVILVAALVLIMALNSG
jgi:hypothetical protein